jgi:hypothetical protein
VVLPRVLVIFKNRNRNRNRLIKVRAAYYVYARAPRARESLRCAYYVYIDRSPVLEARLTQHPTVRSAARISGGAPPRRAVCAAAAPEAVDPTPDGSLVKHPRLGWEFGKASATLYRSRAPSLFSSPSTASDAPSTRTAPARPRRMRGLCVALLASHATAGATAGPSELPTRSAAQSARCGKHSFVR